MKNVLIQLNKQNADSNELNCKLKCWPVALTSAQYLEVMNKWNQ